MEAKAESSKPTSEPQSKLERAVDALRNAEALLICTGAGMGVDSGLGTFRGRHAGVWQPLKALRMDYTEICAPYYFEDDPRLAWAFWCFCYRAYTGSRPHAGYQILARWGARLKHGLFSVTSNIDGHWARTMGVGQKKIYEVHGAVTHMQLLDDEGEGCGRVWPTDDKVMAALELPKWDLAPGEEVEVLRNRDAGEILSATVADDACSVVYPDGKPLAAHTLRRPGQHDLCRISERSTLPHCPVTGKPARPNVLMFGDSGVCPTRISKQAEAFHKWQNSLPEEGRLVIVEVGAGKTIPTIRDIAEEAADKFPHSTLIRINLDDSDAPEGLDVVSIGGMGAVEALTKLDSMLHGSRRARSLGARAASGVGPTVASNSTSVRTPSSTRLPALSGFRSISARASGSSRGQRR